MSGSAQTSSFHHAGLAVTDLERAIAWYEHTVSARVPEGVEIAFVVDDSGAGVELFALDPQDIPAWDGPIAALRGGQAHVAFAVDDLEGAFSRAVSAGGRAVWEPRPSPKPGQRIAFVADLDGNLVELISG